MSLEDKLKETDPQVVELRNALLNAFLNTVMLIQSSLVSVAFGARFLIWMKILPRTKLH